jgi:2-polyprenyl-3-methyl-5-hydroxy-6-metoxy-1,4-benzoquinol methylase
MGKRGTFENELLVRNLLLEYDLIQDGNIEQLSPRTRDSLNTRVMRCRNSGIIFLEGDIAAADYYTAKPIENIGALARVPTVQGEMVSELNDSDLQRRLQFTEMIVAGKSVLDFGCGSGGYLDAARSVAGDVAGIEINVEERAQAKSKGLDVREDIAEFPQMFDTVTMFHTLEHLPDPVATLKGLHQKLGRDGAIVVEVPHARDFLLNELQCNAYRDFTFWSEHLMLHTRDSLNKFLTQAGFLDIEITGCQRYGLENHLHWLARGEPNGHAVWKKFARENLNDAYGEFLNDIDQTDTLIARARKS